MNVPKARITIILKSGKEFEHKIFDDNNVFNFIEHSEIMEEIIFGMDRLVIEDDDDNISIYKTSEIASFSIRQLY